MRLNHKLFLLILFLWHLTMFLVAKGHPKDEFSEFYLFTLYIIL